MSVISLEPLPEPIKKAIAADIAGSRKIHSENQVLEESQLFAGRAIVICSVNKDEQLERIEGIVAEMSRTRHNDRKFFWFKKAPSGRDKRIFLDDCSIVQYLDGSWSQEELWVELT